MLGGRREENLVPVIIIIIHCQGIIKLHAVCLKKILMQYSTDFGFALRISSAL